MRIGTPIDSGIVQRLSGKSDLLWSSYANVNFNEGGEFASRFMGPGKPLPSMLPIDFEVRVNDYDTLRNMFESHDKGRYGSTIKDLRDLADGCEVLRSIIEVCKNQLSVLRWDVQLKGVEGKNPKDVKKETENNPNIKKWRQILKSPDGENTFRQWIRLLAEEMLVTDMICLHRRSNITKSKLFFIPVDGSTIIKKVNKEGRRPLPPAIAYQQKIHGVITKDFTSNELFVYHRNPRVHKFYGFSPVEQVIQIVNIALKRSQFQLNYYTEGNIPDMLLRVSAEWSDAQIAQYQKYWDLMMSGDLAKRRKIRFIPEALDPIEPQKDVLKDEFDEWLARVICHVFSVSPNGFIKNLNRAIGETSRETADEEGLFGRMETMKEIIDLQLSFAGAEDIEFVWIQNRSQDSLKQAEIDAIDVKCGIKSVDEVRDSRGLHPIGVGNMIYTTHGGVALLEGEKDHVEQARTEITQIDGDIPKESAGQPSNPKVIEGAKPVNYSK